MESKIECAYEEAFSRIQLLGKVHDAKLRRLSIIEPYDDEHSPLTYPRLLSDFPVSTDWIMFSSERVGAPPKSAVNLCQRLVTAATFGFSYPQLGGPVGHLFYVVTARLQDIERVIDSELWEQGAGLALPLHSKGDAGLTRRAIRLQLRAGKRRLVSEIEALFKCAVITRHDGDGVDILWTVDWQYSEVIKEWALGLAKKYPLSRWFP